MNNTGGQLILKKYYWFQVAFKGEIQCIVIKLTGVLYTAVSVA